MTLPSQKYVSRAAFKLKGALESLQKSESLQKETPSPVGRGPAGRICLDLGAAHGGFTQILLLHKARRVYAVDVGYGLLDYNLRNDHRVVSLERHDLRYLKMGWFLPEDIVTLRQDPYGLFISSDVSFLSSATVLQSLAQFHRQEMIPFEALILIKPQFEASQKTDRGILKDAKLRQEIVAKIAERAASYHFVVEKILPAAISGRKGNQEYLLYIRR